MSTLTKEEKKSILKPTMLFVFAYLFAALFFEYFLGLDCTLFLIAALIACVGFPILDIQLLTLKELRKKGG